MCDYCGKWFDQDNMLRIRWHTDGRSNNYCLECIEEVKKESYSTPWVKRDGYTIAKITIDTIYS